MIRHYNNDDDVVLAPTRRDRGRRRTLTTDVADGGGRKTREFARTRSRSGPDRFLPQTPLCPSVPRGVRRGGTRPPVRESSRGRAVDNKYISLSSAVAAEFFARAIQRVTPSSAEIDRGRSTLHLFRARTDGRKITRARAPKKKIVRPSRVSTISVRRSPSPAAPSSHLCRPTHTRSKIP